MQKLLNILSTALEEAHEELRKAENMDSDFHIGKNSMIDKKIGEIRGLEKAIEIVKSEQL
ncbi:hypothetical protein [Bacillus cereus group sp. BfR-BA-01328]|uniref:hypothetical protein n=1 Tax=Bacillus cereus group sp. BfR-BA-01328 TaxID=2920304 RepID=UPI001F5763B3